ncbi:MAG: DUF4360 domain-containing protein [Bdellovibrionota bacterium]
MKELVALLALLFATIAHAQNLQVTGPVKSAGRGCPNNDVSVTWSPDMAAFSILFDQLKAETTARGVDNRNCKVAFPLRIDAGWRLRLVQVEHRGFLNLAAGDRGQLIATYKFRGGKVCNDNRCRRSTPTELRRNYAGPISGDLYEVTGASSEWEFSACGGDIQMEIDTHLRVGGPTGSGALMVLDSIDGALNANAVYRMQIERCDEVQPGPGRPGPGPGPRPGPRPIPPPRPRFR